MTTERTYWNGEPCKARIVRVIVADTGDFPLYWAKPYVGTEREAVEIAYNGRTFYIDNEEHSPSPGETEAMRRFGLPAAFCPRGEGWDKVTSGRGSPTRAHRSLQIERVVEDGA